MSTEFVLDADTGYDAEELPPVSIRVDGTVYVVHCPKDSLPVLMGRLQSQDIAADPLGPSHLVRQILLAVFEEEDADELMERLVDMRERKVTLAYLIHVVGMVAEHYREDMEAHYAEMGMENPVAQEVPANRAARRHPGKAAPAKKTAAKKTAAKKAAPARRGAARA